MDFLPSELVISTAVVRAVTNETVKDFKNFIVDKFSKNKTLKQVSINNEDLVGAISKLMLVKTLFSGADKPVNLFDFFQNPKIKYDDNNFSIDTIEDIIKISDSNCRKFILRGTVGQGKSILMRCLSVKDLIINKRIPVFIELKNISKSKNIHFLIKEYLSFWLDNNDDEFIKEILRSGKISLFLDAFDEIDHECLQDVYSDINLLCQSYKKLTVIVSSRPQTIITQNALFEIVDLCPYSLEEQKGLIDKLVKSEENKKILIDTIDKSTHEVKNVLKTPLMVVLFIKQYVVGFSVPHHVADFYKNIFDVVTFTHDRSKGIEKRGSYSSLNQEQLEVIFERFCFETFLVGRTIFDKKSFIDLLKKSIKKNNINDFNDFNNLIFDYTRFACLILQDGSEYTFIHKSIQEYYVAKFIENLPENLAEKVIEKKFSDHMSSDNCLNFLMVLKPYFYNKYYAVKEINKYIEKHNVLFIKDEDNLNKFISSLYICEGGISPENYLGYHYVSEGVMSIFQETIFNLISVLSKKNIVQDGILGWVNDEALSNKEKQDKHQKYIPLSDLNNFNELKVYDDIREAWEDLCDIYDGFLAEIYKIETSVLDDDFDI